MKKLSLFLALVFATMLQFSASALPSYDQVVRQEDGYFIGQFFKEADTGLIYKIDAVTKKETDTEIVYTTYITCFENGTLATKADCPAETAAEQVAGQ